MTRLPQLATRGLKVGFPKPKYFLRAYILVELLSLHKLVITDAQRAASLTAYSSADWEKTIRET